MSATNWAPFSTYVVMNGCFSGQILGGATCKSWAAVARSSGLFLRQCARKSWKGAENFAGLERQKEDSSRSVIRVSFHFVSGASRWMIYKLERLELEKGWLSFGKLDCGDPETPNVNLTMILRA